MDEFVALLIAFSVILSLLIVGVSIIAGSIGYIIAVVIVWVVYIAHFIYSENKGKKNER